MRQYKDGRASGEPVTWADVRAARAETRAAREQRADVKLARALNHIGNQLLAAGLMLAFGVVLVVVLLAIL